MTTPEFPGESSVQTSPHQSQQEPLTQPNYGPPTQTGAPRPRKTKKQPNVVGLIALIAAAIGFIFACIPGALIIGWVLLPIAFVLAIVSLFFKGKIKWTGITALILSIVGTIVGFVVFSAVVATSFDNAFGSGGTTVAAPSGDAAVKNQAGAKADSAANAGTRENPYPVGSVIKSDDWHVVINSVKLAATDAVLAANEFNKPPAKGSEYILVNYSATYVGDDANGQMPAFVSVEYVTTKGTTVNGVDKIAVAPKPIDTTSALYKGGTATGNMAIEVPTATAAQGVLAVRPGMLGDKVFVAVK
jgi:energy-coupling factor transporter transmembrane protein EcfT